MKKIKIYSPFTGYIKKIEDINDPTFSSKALGDGFFIVPENEELICPLEKAKINLIADTKHAIFLECGDINLLIHVGLDTVALNGKPFNWQRVAGEEVALKTLLMSINKENMPNNIDLSTPILFDTNNFSKYEINWKAINKKVKQGQLICEVDYELRETTTEEIVKIQKEISKYKAIAENLINFIGGVNNQRDTYNCMTRLRFKIIDKSKVDENEIKKVSVVKGINWAGEELQVIIGGEAYKIKQECQYIYDEKDNTNIKVQKLPFKKKIAPALTSILFPAIPLLVGTGIIAGIQALLVLAGAISNPAVGQSVNDLDVFSALFYVASKVGIELIGVVFLYNTVKYLKGETPMAILLALLLTSRYLLGSGWVLFHIFGNAIAVRSYESSVIPMIAAGFLVHYLNVWTKKWMPSQVDVVFRTAFVVGLSFVIIMFTVGPFFRIIEQFISKFVILLGDIPLGLGLGIFAMLWQTLVLTGTHVAVVVAITLPMTNEGLPSMMYAGLQIAIMGQMGAAIAVAIRTKNNKIKQTAYGGLPGAIFGITEPLIYGVNLRKFWPFIYGSLGALVGGLFGGIFGILQIQRTGTGVMSYLGMGYDSNLVFALLASAIGLVSAFGITIVFYVDRKSEAREYFKTSKLLFKVLKQTNTIDTKSLEFKKFKNNFVDISIELKKAKIFKEYEQKLVELSNKEIKLQKWNDSYTTRKNKLFDLAAKYEEKNIEKYNELANKYKEFQKGDKFVVIENEILMLNKEVNKLQKDYYSFIENELTKTSKNITKSQFNIDTSTLEALMNKFENSVNNLEISYEISDEKTIDYKLIKSTYKTNRRLELNAK